MRRGQALAGMLDFAVGGNELAPEVREPGATAPRPADARCADRFPERVIEVIEQQPGAAVAHPELAGGLREGARRLDVLEQRDLPRSDRAPGSQIDSQPHTERGAPLNHAWMVAQSVRSSAAGEQAPARPFASDVVYSGT